MSTEKTNQPAEVETLPAVQTTPIVVFKGKLIGDLEETVITADLVREKSKPLLALKINGIFDTAGADEVKSAIQKAVKMRTSLESQADPLIKKINAQAKKDVQAVKDIAEPIYAACRETQNTLQATWDAWKLSVDKAALAEAEALKAKTDGRENKMFELGLTWNGAVFSGYNRVIPKTYLFELDDEKYAALLVELEGLQMEAGVTGEKAEASIAIPSGHTPPPMGYAIPTGTRPPTVLNFKIEETVYDQVVACDYSGIRIVLTKGEAVLPESLRPDELLIKNNRIANSGVYLTVIKG